MAHRVRRCARRRWPARPGRGRTVADVPARLATTPLTWHRNIRHVTIGMLAAYRAAPRAGLPTATVVVDHFHVAQLANKMLSPVRHRTTAEIRGRRGRRGHATDPERTARRRLPRNRQDFTDEQFATVWNPLLDEQKIGQTRPTGSGGSHAQTPLARSHLGHQAGEFHAGMDLQLPEDVPQVVVHRVTRDRQQVGCLTVGEAVGDVFGHHAL
ncbi:transposase [Streptomyces sp. SID12488]|nr:transposase [Streptomyces sp. SID12488]